MPDAANGEWEFPQTPSSLRGTVSSKLWPSPSVSPLVTPLPAPQAATGMALPIVDTEEGGCLSRASLLEAAPSFACGMHGDLIRCPRFEKRFSFDLLISMAIPA